MGIVKISDGIHDELRKASDVFDRSLNSQAEHWIKIGMLCELHPSMNYEEVRNLLLSFSTLSPLSIDKIIKKNSVEMIALKTEQDLVVYRKTGQIAGEVLTRLIPEMQAGVSTYYLAKLAEKWIIEDYDAVPASIGQYGFKFSLCSSINHVVCHGVPSEREILKDGDIVNMDVTVKKHGFIADTSRMYLIGEPSDEASRLCKVTRECLFKGIEQVKPGNFLGDVGFAVNKHATRHGYSIVKEYCGHGIGRAMHEEPEVAHHGKKGKGLKLQEGMVFTIEPMVNQGSSAITHLADDWTAVTRDGKLSAQWEHTIAVTKTGFEILTLRDEEKQGT